MQMDPRQKVRSLRGQCGPEPVAHTALYVGNQSKLSL
jgi:hypothetical protein